MVGCKHRGGREYADDAECSLNVGTHTWLRLIGHALPPRKPLNYCHVSLLSCTHVDTRTHARAHIRTHAHTLLTHPQWDGYVCLLPCFSLLLFRTSFLHLVGNCHSHGIIIKRLPSVGVRGWVGGCGSEGVRVWWCGRRNGYVRRKIGGVCEGIKVFDWWN